MESDYSEYYTDTHNIDIDEEVIEDAEQKAAINDDDEPIDEIPPREYADPDETE